MFRSHILFVAACPHLSGYTGDKYMTVCLLDDVTNVYQHTLDVWMFNVYQQRSGIGNIHPYV